MLFLFETKKNGIISVNANIVDGELELRSPSSEVLGKREAKDLEKVALTLLSMEGQNTEVSDRDYK